MSHQRQLSIRGNSGCVVSVVETPRGAVVVKSAAGLQSDRLRLQIDKQRAARRSNTLSYVRVPAVLDETTDGDAYAATMEYVYFQSAPEFFNRASITDIGRVAEHVVGFVQGELQRSTTTRVPIDPVVTKLATIEASLAPTPRWQQYRPHVLRLRARALDFGAMDLPIGACHGDLTMSNIMIASDSSAIALIDFLDSFIESPLIDLAKLRQDTRFHWSALMTESAVDRLRYGQVMGALDELLQEPFAGLDWHANYLGFMTELTLLRIAPYATGPAVHDFILQSLSQPSPHDH